MSPVMLAGPGVMKPDAKMDLADIPIKGGGNWTINATSGTAQNALYTTASSITV